MLPVRKNIRLPSFDYSAPCVYFITICTAGRRLLLGDVVDGVFAPSRLGDLVERCWRQIPRDAPYVSLDEFRCMPNHVHGLLGFGMGPNARGRTPVTLGSVMRTFKTATTRRARTLGLLGADEDLWQRGYYEHAVRSDEALWRIQEYIRHNPQSWHEDRENPVRRGLDTFDGWLTAQGRLPPPS